MTDADRDPADALSVVAHEVRLDILRALWDAENHSLSFSSLREAVGVRDGGRFNYHLSKLEGQFLTHVEDRYELLYPGHRVIDAVQSGVLHREATAEPIDCPGSCPDCGGGLAFTYEAFLARIECLDCSRTVLGYPFDPGGFVGREDAAVPAAFDRRTRRYWLTAIEGVCPVCAGPTDAHLVDEATTLQALDRYEDHYASDQPAIVATDCQHCSFYTYVAAGVTLLTHPGVVGRLYESGIDAHDRPLWTLPFVVDADRVDTQSADPLGVTVTAGHDGRLRVTVDETASIAAIDGP